ncbi:MAG: hypothetical protein O7E56_09855 [SAR324 cluster bacterium]|nr:hypothetical protein [SAR324 cluster bacterium]
MSEHMLQCLSQNVKYSTDAKIGQAKGGKNGDYENVTRIMFP